MPAKVPDVISCNSATFAYELQAITDTLAKPESEDTWDTLGRAIQRWNALLKGGAPAEDHIAGLRAQSRVIIRCLNSERTILSGHAITLLEQTAVQLGAEFESICALYIPVLLGLCARTVKLYVTRARACLLTIVDEAHPPAIVSHLRHAMDTKSSSLRLTVAEVTLACLNSMNPADLAKEARAKDIESVIRVAIKDANPDVRRTGRKAYEAYAAVLSSRVSEFIRPLTPTTRKYLGLKSSESSSQPGSRPPSAMSRPASRADAQANHQTVVPSRPAPRPRIVSTNETRKRIEGASSPPLANTFSQSGPSHSAPVVHTLARRVPDIAAATGDGDSHVRSNSLRGGAFNSGAASREMNVRGPARVAHVEAPKPVPTAVETSEVKTTKAPATAPGLARSQPDALRPAENVMSTSQLNRASNSKSSGPTRAAAVGTSRPPGRVPMQRSTSIQTSSSTTLKPDLAGKALSRSTSTTSSIDLASSTTSNSSTATTTAKRAAPVTKPAPPPSKAPTVKRADVAKPTSSSRTMGPPAQVPKRPAAPSSSSTTTTAATKSAPRDLTRPTASQMARMQAAQPTAKAAPKDVKSIPASKPAWGRTQPSTAKPVPPTSRVNAAAKRDVPSREPRTGAAHRLKAATGKAKSVPKEVKKAAAVPLPPSPKIEPVVVPEVLEGDAAAELDEDKEPGPPDLGSHAITPEAETPMQALPPAPYPEMSMVVTDDDSEESSSDDENEVEPGEEAEPILPTEEPILQLSDEEDDLADLEAHEEHEGVKQELPQIIPVQVDEEPVHQRSDTESEDMQMTAVVDHDRHLTGESDYTLRIPDSFILDGSDSPPKPNILPVPATPISTLLSSIQNGFLPSAAHPSLLPSPPDAAEYASLHPNTRALPPAFPLSLTSSLKRTAEHTNEGTILFGAKAMIATDESLERGVLTEKQM